MQNPGLPACLHLIPVSFMLITLIITQQIKINTKKFLLMQLLRISSVLSISKRPLILAPTFNIKLGSDLIIGIIFLTNCVREQAMVKFIVNVNVFSHLLSAAYNMTRGPLHMSL